MAKHKSKGKKHKGGHGGAVPAAYPNNMGWGHTTIAHSTGHKK